MFPPALPVADRFWFAHRDLGPQGSVTVRLTSMTGTITYPPPDHDEIVPGLVPWAKAGIIIKAGQRPGSPYAALMMTGDHGVRLQHGYRHDIAGSAGRDVPHWLRLTRDGTSITGAESFDGQAWHTVGTVAVPGLPVTAQVGLFATSPGDLTVTGGAEQMRFTQAVGVFDSVSLTGAPEQEWRSNAVGELNRTDWERLHQPAGARFAADGTITVSGSGDIGPIGEDGPPGADAGLSGMAIALIAVRLAAYPDHRSAFVTGALTGLITSGATLAAGRAILTAVILAWGRQRAGTAEGVTAGIPAGPPDGGHAGTNAGQPDDGGHAGTNAGAPNDGDAASNDARTRGNGGNVGTDAGPPELRDGATGRRATGSAHAT